MSRETSKDIITQIEPILRKYDIKKASLFGSFARGEENARSDIDVLVEFPEGSDLFDLVDLRAELSEAIGRNVDVATFGSLSPYRREFILKDQVSIL